ncbi:MAG: hypothetical protein K0R28_5298 [Paenibacillus sp.]|nr:hypothetical protein [Paenibacillus sp.]
MISWGVICISIEFGIKKSAILLFMAAAILSLFAISDKGFAENGANLAIKSQSDRISGSYSVLYVWL